jgi:hypothetical protein
VITHEGSNSRCSHTTQRWYSDQPRSPSKTIRLCRISSHRRLLMLAPVWDWTTFEQKTQQTSICLGLQADGVLSIQHVPALWIDIGDQAYKVRRYVTCKGIPPLAHRGMQICFPAPGDVSETSQEQPLDLNYTQCEQRRENSSKPLQSRDPRCMHLRKESKRSHNMAGFLKAVEILGQCNDFSFAPATCETAWELSLPSRNPNVPSPHDSQAIETDPIRRVRHRLYRLEQLEKQAENLSLYTNNAYHAVGLA